MSKELATTHIKVWVESRKLLRFIAAITNEQILQVVHRLAKQEWDRLDNGERKEDVQNEVVDQ